jgi:hypothetical protein
MKAKIIKVLNFIRSILSKFIIHAIPAKSYNKSAYELYKDEMINESYNHFKKYFIDAVFISNKSLHFDYSIKKSLKLNGDTKNGLFIEFGVYKGKNVNYISKFAEKVYGFDTFTGLTEDWVGGNVNHFEGAYSLEGNIPKVNKNVILIKGDVRDTLEPYLKNINSKIHFISIDIDTYESTKFVLSKVKNYFSPSTIIYFDEFYNFVGWKSGEYKAFKEEIEYDGNFSFKYLAFTKNSSGTTILVTKK